MSTGCRFIMCAVKRKRIESCGERPELNECEKWSKHRDYSLHHDTIVCYQKLEDSVSIIQKRGIESFDDDQQYRESLLRQMLEEFNEGRSKNYFCISATVFEIYEIEDALWRAREISVRLNLSDKSKIIHQILDSIAERRGLCTTITKMVICLICYFSLAVSIDQGGKVKMTFFK